MFLGGGKTTDSGGLVLQGGWTLSEALRLILQGCSPPRDWVDLDNGHINCDNRNLKMRKMFFECSGIHKMLGIFTELKG